MTDVQQAVPVAQEALYLIRKNGMFYRPNSQGYTCDAAYAGRFTLSEAIRHSHPNGPDGPRDGIDYMLADEPAAPVVAETLERQVRIAAWNAAKKSGATDDLGYAVVEAVVAEFAAIRLLSQGGGKDADPS